MKSRACIVLFLLLCLPSIVFAAYPTPPQYKGMVNPVEGEAEVTSDFGWRTHPIYGTKKFHSGVDFGYDYNLPIHAAYGGVVTTAGWISGYGYTVAIDHGGNIETLYGHNTMVTVVEGQTVTAGQVIALAGSTGNSTGPHCHFEVRVNGEPVSPWDWLTGTPPPGSGDGIMMDDHVVNVSFDAYYDMFKPVRDMIDTFGRVCTKGLTILQDHLGWLFFALMTIDLALSGLGLLLGEGMGAVGMVRWLLAKILFYGFATFLFFHWGDVIANTLRYFFVSMGAFSTGHTYTEAETIVTDPTGIVQIGTQYVGPIFEYLGTMWGISAVLHIPTILLCVITIFVILFCFFYIGIQLALAYIEFYCTALFGLISFSFTPFQGTRKFGANAVNGLFVSALKLMVFSIVALLVTVALRDSVPEDYFNTTTVSVAAGGNFQNVDEFMAAIRQVETGGCEDPYHTPSQDGYGYGAYQISYSNWDSWCAEAGIEPPPGMPWPPDVQDRVARHKMQTLYEQYGNWHDVAICWNAGSVVSWDEGYWQKVCSGGGTHTEKTIDVVVLLKMMFVALAAMLFGHADGKAIMRAFGHAGFRFPNQGMIRGFRI